MGSDGEARLVEALADRPHPPVHHVRGGDDVGARLRVRDGHPGEQRQGRVVLHLAVLDDAAVAVRGVLAQAHVGDDQQLLAGGADRADRLLHDAVVGVALGAHRVLGRGQAEEDHPADPQLLDLLGLARHLVDREVEAAGQRRDLAAQPLAGGHEERVDRGWPGRASSRAPSRAAARSAAAAGGARTGSSCLLVVVVAEEEQVGAALAAEDPAVLAAAAVVADHLEADGALHERHFLARSSGS